MGRWADLHLAFLKEHQPHAYVEMLFADKLVPYLRDLQAQAETWYQRMVEQIWQAEGVTEEWKARDPMAWVGRMNGITAPARKIVMEEWGETITKVAGTSFGGYLPCFLDTLHIVCRTGPSVIKGF